MGAFARLRPSVPAVRRPPRWAGRAARLALLLVATSMATFALVAASPIDPVRANLGQAAYAQMSEAQRAQLAEYWGATTPLPARYAHWAASVLRGDFGQSLRFGRPVVEVVGERFANSAALMASAWLLAGVLGLVALMVFSVWRGWVPLGYSVPIGVDAAQVSWAQKLHHLVLPALVLGVANAPGIALHTRQKTIDVLGSEPARFARSRGEKGAQLLLRHGLRNLVLPAITIECASVSEVFGGSVLVEQVFSYPGLGQAAVTAGLGGDAPLLVAIALVSACVVFAGNACADMLYALIDPRIREGRGSRDA